MNETPARYGNAIHIPDHRERNKAAMVYIREVEGKLPYIGKCDGLITTETVGDILRDLYSILQLGRRADL